MTVAGLTLFGAVLAQIALTLVLYLTLVRTRFKLLTDRSQARAEMAYDQAAWPVSARLISNSVISQFELPVLFYAATLFAFVLGPVNFITAGLAWAFVAARLLHALIHTGKNVVPRRFGAFLAGFVVVIVFWIVITIHVFTATT